MNKNNNNKLLIVSNNSKELDIDNNKEEIIINIYGNSKEKIEGKSFKITEENRIMYKIFSNFFEELKDEYNAFKDFHDFYFSNQPLYDEKHNWFSFYSGNNMFRIIKNQNNEPYIIGMYIKSNNEAFILKRNNQRYAQFLPCFDHFTKELEKVSNEQSKLYTKELNNG